MNEKTEVHIVWPPQKNVHVVFFCFFFFVFVFCLFFFFLFFSFIPQGNEKKINCQIFIQNLRANSRKKKQTSNWTESARINLPTAMAEWLFNFELPSLKEFETPKIKAVQTVSISLLSVTFSCILRLWLKRCCCDVVYNDVTRDSIACSLTLCHVTENRYVKYPVHKIHGDMNPLF